MILLSYLIICGETAHLEKLIVIIYVTDITFIFWLAWLAPAWGSPPVWAQSCLTPFIWLPASIWRITKMCYYQKYEKHLTPHITYMDVLYHSVTTSDAHQHHLNNTGGRGCHFKQFKLVHYIIRWWYIFCVKVLKSIQRSKNYSYFFSDIFW